MKSLRLLPLGAALSLAACAQIEMPEPAVPDGFHACGADGEITHFAAIDPGTAQAGLAVVCGPRGARTVGGHVEIWRLEPDGYSREALLDAGDNLSGASAGDLDGDGDLDLAVIARGQHERSIAVFENRGAAGVDPDPIVIAMGGMGLDFVVFHDANADGRMDLLTGGGSRTHPVILLNQGPDASPRFTEDTLLARQDNLGLSAGQLTDDAREDLVVALNRRGQLHLFAGGGEATHVIMVGKAVRAVDRIVGGGDLNGDAAPDFLARFWTDESWNEEEPIATRVLLSQAGSEDYTLGAFLDGAHEARRAFLGDFAGEAEIAVFTDNSLSAEPPHALLYAPDADGWTRTGRLDLPARPRAWLLADLDGNGTQELITGYRDGEVRVEAVGE